MLSRLVSSRLVAIPWADMDWKQIRDEVLVNNATLPINFDLIPLPFSRIIKDGLNLSSINRMSFEDVKANLESVRNVTAPFRNLTDAVRLDSDRLHLSLLLCG